MGQSTASSCTFCIFNQQLGKHEQKPTKPRTLNLQQLWKMPGALVTALSKAALHHPHVL